MIPKKYLLQLRPILFSISLTWRGFVDVNSNDEHIHSKFHGLIAITRLDGIDREFPNVIHILCQEQCGHILLRHLDPSNLLQDPQQLLLSLYISCFLSILPLPTLIPMSRLFLPDFTFSSTHHSERLHRSI
jgi:hypothetical protein